MNPFLFLKLKETLTGAEFPWFKSKIVAQTEDIQLIHTFYEFGRVNSQFFELLDPCLRFLKMKKLIRAKVNLVLRADKIIEHGYHVDTDGYKKFRSALLYVNSNNGYTDYSNNGNSFRMPGWSNANNTWYGWFDFIKQTHTNGNTYWHQSSHIWNSGFTTYGGFDIRGFVNATTTTVDRYQIIGASGANLTEGNIQVGYI